MTSSKIGILGTGAIGSVISTQFFEKEGIELLHFNRSKTEQIKLQSPTKFYSYPIDCQTVTNEKQNLDWLIICLKEHHFSEAKNWFKNLISSKTKVAIIRNGINLKEPILPFCESKNILECMIDCPVQKEENGIFQQFKNPKITVPSGKLAEEFAILFRACPPERKSELKVEQVEDFKTATWIKLCESTAIGALTCLCGESCRIFQDEKMVNLYQEILAECVAVGKGDGANFPENYIAEMLLKLKKYPPEKGSSMLTDRLAGKPIELGAKNGAIAKTGNRLGIKTPLNDFICLLLKFTNQ